MDDDLRRAQRAWEQGPSAVTTDAYVLALRRANEPVPLAVLEARECAPRRIVTDVRLDVRAQLADGRDVYVGVPSKHPGEGLELPACQEWWFAPESATFDAVDTVALRELGVYAPDDELIRACARGRDLRRLTVHGARGQTLDVTPLRSLETLEELTVTGAVDPPSWLALADHPGLRVIRHPGARESLEALERAAPLRAHVLGWVPRPRPRRF